MAKNLLTESQKSDLKRKLLTEETALTKTINELSEQDPFKNPDHALDNAAVDTDVREQLGHDTIEAEIKSLERKLELVRHAIQKMLNGGYGICEKTKEPIPYERLSIVPEARHTIEYERKLVK